MQQEIYINNIKVPIIIDNGVIYYPVSYIMGKILLKKTNTISICNSYEQYINKYNIDYGNNNIQEVYCISENGLKLVLSDSKLGRLSIEQKKAMNILLEYLGMDVISEDGRFIKTVSKDIYDKYNIYIKDCIDCVLTMKPNIVWQRCTKCGIYYPYHINFFKENLHSGKEYPLYTVCRNCSGWSEQRTKDYIKHNIAEFNTVYNKYGEDIYKLYREHNTIEIYKHWLSCNTKAMPSIINNKEDKLKIIKHCYDKGLFNDSGDLNKKAIKNVCKFNTNEILQNEIHKFIFGKDQIYTGTINDFDVAKKIFDDYIIKNNIVIEDIFTFNYDSVIRKSILRGFLKRCCNNDLLSFIMKYHENKYGAYKFKSSYKKYWESKENRIKALKYFIEEDMKINLEKVPLYVTLTALRKDTSTLYSVCKKYYHSLFEWVNEVYPDAFIEKDFDIHYVRNDFDSIEEAEIHDVLCENFKNVLYNPRNTDRTVVIDGMIPDWFIFTNNNCYIVEYFGIAIDHGVYNQRIHDYQEKTKHKMEKYKKIKGYKKVYLFPDDLKDNFRGVLYKLKMVV